MPDAWGAILGRVQAMAPSAVIAGGALRDLAWGGQVKDIDIFVSHEDTAVALLNKRYGWKRTLYVPEHAAPYLPLFRNGITELAEYAVPDFDLPVQVIALAAPAKDFRLHAIERFDFDACQACWSDGKTTCTQGFLIARERRLMTLERTESVESVQRSFERAVRFSAKYPDAFFDFRKASADHPDIQIPDVPLYRPPTNQLLEAFTL